MASRNFNHGGIYGLNSDEKCVVEWRLDTGNAAAHKIHVTVDGHLIAVRERGRLLINKGYTWLESIDAYPDFCHRLWYSPRQSPS